MPPHSSLQSAHKVLVKLLFRVLIELIVLLHQGFLWANEGGSFLADYGASVASVIWRSHIANVVVFPRVGVC